MLTLQTTTKFRKDYKRMKKQNKDMSLLQDVLDTLLAEKPLEDDFTHTSHMEKWVKHCKIKGLAA